MEGKDKIEMHLRLREIAALEQQAIATTTLARATILNAIHASVDLDQINKLGEMSRDLGQGVTYMQELRDKFEGRDDG
jgi:hypothetical protein